MSALSSIATAKPASPKAVQIFDRLSCQIGSLVFTILLLITLTLGSVSAQQASHGDPLVTFSKSLTAVPDPASLTNRGSFYAPAFSSVRIEQGQTRLNLAITLSIHNSSETEPLVINRIDYFDTSGKLVQRFLGSPIALRPFGTFEIFVSRDDTRGGTGANFVVDWAAKGPIEEPTVETVMIGSIGTNSYSFTTQGRAIRKSQQ
jgi:uncharacterized protein DUF3124